MRLSLLQLAKFDIPSVDVTPGKASISWRWELDPQAFEAALEALLGLRTLPPAFTLREQSNETAPRS